MKERIVESFKDLLDTTIELAPNVLVGIVLLIIAVIFAKVVERVLRSILTRLDVDKLVQRAGVDQALSRIGLRQELNIFLPRLAYFLILMLLARTLAQAAGLEAISEAFGAFFSYLPSLIAALLLLILGSAAAQFAGKAVCTAAEGAGIDFAPTLGRVVTALIIFIVGVMAVSQLKIETEIIRIVTTVMLGAAGLAFALSVGLGTRDVSRNVVTGFYVKRLFEPGTVTEIDGHRGTVIGVTATHTVLKTDEGLVRIANSRFLETVAKG